MMGPDAGTDLEVAGGILHLMCGITDGADTRNNGRLQSAATCVFLPSPQTQTFTQPNPTQPSTA